MNELQERILKEIEGLKIEVLRTGDDEENTETVIDWADESEKAKIAEGITEAVEDYIQKVINSKLKFVKEGMDRIEGVLNDL